MEEFLRRSIAATRSQILIGTVAILSVGFLGWAFSANQGRSENSRAVLAFGDVDSPWGLVVDAQGKARTHMGVDIKTVAGSEVLVPVGATVRFVGTKRGYGHCVFVETENGGELRFGHLKEIGVKPGERVEAGDVLGKMPIEVGGSFPKLHFEIWQNGRPIDPTVPKDFELFAQSLS